MSPRGTLDRAKRLELIVEAIRYCQRVKAMGMPVACYSKALREPVYFLWEGRDGLSKRHRPRFCSRRASDLHFGKGALVYDHAIPFRYLQNELLALSEPTASEVEDVLSRHGVVVLITKEEDQRLCSAGYRNRMPDDWDGVDPLARYGAVGLEIVENPRIAPGARRRGRSLS